MTKCVFAKDFTHSFVDQSVLQLMTENMVEGDIIDFTDRYIMDSDLVILAETMIELGIKAQGLDDDSLAILESHLRKLESPEFETIQDFMKMFEAKFPKGTYCIWDKLLSPKLEPNQTKVSLVCVEGIYNNYVHFRLYKSHLVQPKYVSKYGGLDAKELYTLENAHISDFINKTIIFRYPKDEQEEIIFHLLTNIEVK